MLLSLSGRIVQFAVMFMTVKVMTTYLQPEELGKVALITAVCAFFAMFLINPVGTYINRHLNTWQKEKTLRSALVCYTKYLLLVALIASVAICGLCLLRIREVENWGVIAILVPLTLLVGTANQTLIPSLNLLGLAKEFTCLNVLSVVLSLSIAAILVHFGNPTALFWLFGILIGQGLATIGATFVYLRHPELDFAITGSRFVLNIKEILAFSLPVSVTAGFLWLNFQGYRLVLTEYISLEQLGIFVAGYGLAVQMTAAAEIVLNTWFQPKFYQRCDSTKIELFKLAWPTYAQQISIPMIFIIAGGVVFAPFFVMIVLGPAYQKTVLFYQMGLVVEFIRVLIGTSTLFFHQHKITNQLMAPNIVGAVLAVLLMCLFVSHYGDIMILPGLALGALATLLMTLMRIGRIQKFDVTFPIRFFLALICAAFLTWLLETLINKDIF